ncbi:exo-alpha-sialidase [candidate division KSB1 bacterium]|nr:exo-alpha-sialidase [candidate division KSB1 bacterium]
MKTKPWFMSILFMIVMVFQSFGEMNEFRGKRGYTTRSAHTLNRRSDFLESHSLKRTSRQDFSEPILIDQDSYALASPHLIHLGGDSILALYAQHELRTRLSTDAGHSWGDVQYFWDIIFYNDVMSVFRDDAGVIHLYYMGWHLHPYEDSGLWYSFSTNLGQTWAEPELVELLPTADFVQFLRVTRTRDGSCWFFYTATFAGVPQAFLSRRHADGHYVQELQFSETVDDITFSGSLCSLNDGSLMLVYQQVKNNRSHIYRRYSRDEGQSWSQADILCNENAYDEAPYLHVNEVGRLTLVFTSDRGEHYGRNLWATHSSDNGGSWEPVQRITDFAGFDMHPHILEYRGKELIAWESNRFGTFGIWIGAIGETVDSKAPPLCYIDSVTPGTLTADGQLVTAFAVDEEEIAFVNLLYGIIEDNWIYQKKRMVDDGMHDDLIAGDHIYSARIGPYDQQRRLKLQIEVADRDGNTLVTPDWPLWVQIYDVQNAGNLWSVFGNQGEIGDINDILPSMEWPGDSQNQYLCQGGFWIGALYNYQSLVIAPMYGEEGWHVARNAEWTSSTTLSDKDMGIDFESHYEEEVGVRIAQTSYGWKNADYIILEYIAFNKYPKQLTNFYFGLWSDFDVSTFDGIASPAVDDAVGFDHQRRLVYMYDVDNPDTAEEDTGEPDSEGVLQTPGYIGTALIDSPTDDCYMSWWRNGQDPDNNSEAYIYLSAPLHAYPTTEPDDYRILLSIGPMTIPPRDSVRIVIGYVIGAGLSQLQANTDQMKAMARLIVDVKDRENFLDSCYLAQNTPNPFNNSTTIRYVLPEPCFVSLDIYNIRGERITTLVNEKQARGDYRVQWQATNVASGVYLYRLQAGDYIEMKRLVVLR